MEANNLQSYYVKVTMQIKGTDVKSEALCIDLKDPEYRFHTSPNAYCPPGTASIWGNQQQQQQPQQQVQQPQQMELVQPQPFMQNDIVQEKTQMRNPQATAGY